MGLHHSPKIVTNGLVLALDAGDRNSYTSGSSIWNDLSGNGYNATLVNSPDFSSVDSGKIQLDGVDDYIDLPSNTNRNNTIKNSTFTIVFNDSRLVTGGNINNQLYGLSSVLNCYWKRGGDTLHYIRVNNVTEPTLNLGEINEDVKHLTLVIDENYLTSFYVNGTLRTTYDYSGNAIDYTWTFSFNFGVNSQLAYDAFDYHMISLYNRALSENEVLQNYNALKGRFGLQ